MKVVLRICNILLAIGILGQNQKQVNAELTLFDIDNSEKLAFLEWSNHELIKIVLKKTSNSNCIYKGKFKEDQNSKVLVTGCSNDEFRNVQIQSIVFGDTIAKVDKNGRVEHFSPDEYQGSGYRQKRGTTNSGSSTDSAALANPYEDDYWQDFNHGYTVKTFLKPTITLPAKMFLHVNLYASPSYRYDKKYDFKK